MKNKLVVMDAEDLGRMFEDRVAAALARVVGDHAREVEELRRSLFVQKRLLDEREAGLVLGGVKPETVREYVQTKGLQCYKPGRAALYRVEDLEAFALRFPYLVGGGQGDPPAEHREAA